MGFWRCSSTVGVQSSPLPENVWGRYAAMGALGVAVDARAYDADRMPQRCHEPTRHVGGPSRGLQYLGSERHLNVI